MLSGQKNISRRKKGKFEKIRLFSQTISKISVLMSKLSSGIYLLLLTTNKETGKKKSKPFVLCNKVTVNKRKTMS